MVSWCHGLYEVCCLSWFRWQFCKCNKVTMTIQVHLLKYWCFQNFCDTLQTISFTLSRIPSPVATRRWRIYDISCFELKIAVLLHQIKVIVKQLELVFSSYWFCYLKVYKTVSARSDAGANWFIGLACLARLHEVYPCIISPYKLRHAWLHWPWCYSYIRDNRSRGSWQRRRDWKHLQGLRP